MRIADSSRRERRVVAAGLAIVVLTLLTRFAFIPFALRWSEREATIASTADRIARLRSLIADESRLRSALRSSASSTAARRLVTGRTTALAGSALQAAIQSAADRSRVAVNRLDLAGAPDSATGGLPSIPVTISAVGDVYGLSEFLSMLENGTPVIQVKQLTVVSNSSLRGGLVQMSLQLSAPAVIE
jgi:hypothetical protein